MAQASRLKMDAHPMQPKIACFIVDPEVSGPALSAMAESGADQVLCYVRGKIPDACPSGGRIRFLPLRGTEDIDLDLARHGEVHAITDLTGDDPRTKAERVRQLLFALAPGGIYRVRSAESGQDGRELPGWLGRILEGIAAGNDRQAMIESLADQGEKGFAKAVAGATKDPNGWTILKAGSHLVRLRDADANEELERAFGGAWGRVITSLPAADTPRPAALHMHHRRRPHRDLDSIGAVPPLHMREYNDVIVAPRQIAIRGNYFLPDTFRFHQHPRLNHDLLEYSSNTRSSVPPSICDAAEMEGTYYYLDTIYPGHFGHVMTEVVSRLWGWDDAKRLYPGIKALASVRNAGEKVPEYEFDLLQAYGIGRDEVCTLERPARIRKLIAVTPMFHNTRYVSPEIRAHWKRIRVGMGIADGAGNRRKIFVGRGSSRGCVNAAEVEAAFRHHGFEVIRPERHPMKEQIEIFSSASAIAGFAGSGMFTAMFSDSPVTKIVISQEAYNAVNEYLQSGVTGDDIHYFWCEPSLDHPLGQWLLAAFRSNFTFDFVNHGDALYDLLETLE